MYKFRIVPLTKEYAKKIRASRKDDFGHDIVEEVATGRGPCRVSLKPFKTGEDKRLVLSHSPFSIDNAFNQPGPIFISADEEIEEYSDVFHFPPEIKNDKEHFTITLIGYSTDQKMVLTRLVADHEDVDELIEEIFDEKQQVDYLHARSAKACCYICKIVRA